MSRKFNSFRYFVDWTARDGYVVRDGHNNDIIVRTIGEDEEAAELEAITMNQEAGNTCTNRSKLIY